jgi:hypothetical protein
MKKQVFALLAGGALLAFASTANAGEVRRLTDNQMDAVSAGAVSLANAAGITFGEVISDTVSQTSTFASTIAPRFVVAQAFNQSVAAGGFLFNAQAASHADSYASWLP